MKLNLNRVLQIRERRNEFLSLNDSLCLSSDPDSYDRLAERATSESAQCVDAIMKEMNDGIPSGSLFDLVGPPPATTHQVVQTQPQVTPYQTGVFQQNILNTAPIEPLNDVEMDMNGMQ